MTLALSALSALSALTGAGPAAAAPAPRMDASASPSAPSTPAAPGALGHKRNPDALLDHRYLWDIEGNLLLKEANDGTSNYAYDAQNRESVSISVRAFLAQLKFFLHRPIFSLSAPNEESVMDMSIFGVAPQSAAASTVTEKKASAGAREEAAPPPAQDKVTLSGQHPSQQEPLTYGAPTGKITQADLAKMIEDSDRKTQAVMDLIRPLVEQQGLNLSRIAAGEQKLSVDPATIEAAKAAIADGGEFSVEKTSERILAFARVMIGADPSRAESIRAAVEKGFEQAQDVLGGTLPEISQKTRDAVRAGFDQWEKDGLPAN